MALICVRTVSTATPRLAAMNSADWPFTRGGRINVGQDFSLRYVRVTISARGLVKNRSCVGRVIEPSNPVMAEQGITRSRRFTRALVYGVRHVWRGHPLAALVELRRSSRSFWRNTQQADVGPGGVAFAAAQTGLVAGGCNRLHWHRIVAGRIRFGRVSVGVVAMGGHDITSAFS
jgi:hypothetical protein